MKTSFRRSFERDVRKVQDKTLLPRLKEAIESIEAADSLYQISGFVKMSGSSNYYRLRIGDYRVGVAVEEDVVEFVRFLHRREIYRYFP